MSIDPIRIYEINKQVSTLQTAVFNSAVGANQSVIAAVTGKRIRIMGMTLQAASTAGDIIFKSGTSGTNYITCVFKPPALTLPPFLLPVTDSGYCETVTGEPVYADVGTAACYVNLFYITYTPV